MRKVLKLLHESGLYSTLSSPDGDDGGGDDPSGPSSNKKRRFHNNDNHNSSNRKPDHSNRSGKKEDKKDASFWLSSYNNCNGCTDHGNAWASFFHEPSEKCNQDLIKVNPSTTLQYELIRVGPKRSTNLLDLFKEVEVWKELIPPRPNQPALKSPPPIGAHPHLPFSTSSACAVGNMSISAPTLRLQEMLSRSDYSTQQQVMAASINSRSERHISTGEPSGAILGELDAITKLLADSQQTNNSGGQPMSVGAERSNSSMSTPSDGGPIGEGNELHRRKSIQDSIDAVISARESPSPFPQDAAIRFPLPTGTTTNKRPQTLAHRPPHPHSVGPSRSFDFGDFGRTQSADVFDFEKSEPTETGSMVSPMTTPLSALPPNTGQFVRTEPPAYPFPTGGPSQAIPFGAPAAVAPPKARRGRGRGQGRGGGRGAGGRQMSVDGVLMPPKEPKQRRGAGGARKPRKPRVPTVLTIGHQTNVAACAGPSPCASSPFVPTGTPTTLPQHMFTPPATLLSDKSSNVINKEMCKLNERPVLTPLATLTDSSGTPKVASIDTSPEPQTSGDDSLRKQIRDVLNSKELNNKADESPNIFENITGALSDKASDSTSRLSSAGSTARSKPPNIPSKAANRIEAIIGKMNKQALVSKMPASDLYDDGIQRDDTSQPGSIPSLGPESVFEQETNSRSPLINQSEASSSDPLKVVIRRTQLQPSPTHSQKSLVVRQKSDPAADTAAVGPLPKIENKLKIAKQRLVEKFDSKLKPKSSKKRKHSEDGSAKAAKASKTGETKTASLLGLPGAAGSLKGFRIPKVVEPQPPALKPSAETVTATTPTAQSTRPDNSSSGPPTLSSAFPPAPRLSQQHFPPSAQSSQQAVSQRPTALQPTPKAANVPKSILKNPMAMQQKSSGFGGPVVPDAAVRHIQPPTRKALLPSPVSVPTYEHQPPSQPPQLSVGAPAQ